MLVQQHCVKSVKLIGLDYLHVFIGSISDNVFIMPSPNHRNETASYISIQSCAILCGVILIQLRRKLLPRIRSEIISSFVAAMASYGVSGRPGK